MKNQLRGHEIELCGKEWVYSDTKEPTVGKVRPCGYCGKENTPEDHDGCLGAIDGVMNACCGHGSVDDAYVQYLYGVVISGIEAINAFGDINK